MSKHRQIYTVIAYHYFFGQLHYHLVKVTDSEISAQIIAKKLQRRDWYSTFRVKRGLVGYDYDDNIK